MSHPFFERHRATLDRAVEAIAQRSYWSAYPESASPKVYGEGAAEAGKAAFDALKGKPFPLEQPGTIGTVGGEVSPYGIPLGVTYPKPDLDTLFAAISKAQASWRKAGPEAWAGVCVETLARIKMLAVPPAWSDVWICPDANGHLQATGRDARGRKQHRYHRRWREVRDENKYNRMIAFGKALPRIRAQTRKAIRRPGLGREKVLAAIIRLLELSAIRVGNDRRQWARSNTFPAWKLIRHCGRANVNTVSMV